MGILILVSFEAQLFVCVCVCMCVCVCVCVCIYMSVCVYIYIYIYMFVYTHIFASLVESIGLCSHPRVHWKHLGASKNFIS